MSTSTGLEPQPKRVILRLRVNDFGGGDPSEYSDAIRAYLAFAGRPISELGENRHYAHIEPFQGPEIPQRSFHIILNLEKDSFHNSNNFQNLPHEIYRVRRDKQGKL